MVKPSKTELKHLDGILKKQYLFEKWWVEEKVSQELERVDFLRDRNRVTTDRNVRAIVTKLAGELALEIEAKLSDAQMDGRVAVRKHVAILEKICEDVEPFELAYLILATTINAVMGMHKGFITMASLSASLCEALEEEMKLRAMLAIEPELPGIVDQVLKDSRSSIQHRKRVFVNLFHKKAGVRLPPTMSDNYTRLAVGTTLLELLQTTPGVTLFKFEKTYFVQKDRVQAVVRPTKLLRDLLYREQDLTWLARRTTPLGILLYKPGKRKWNKREMLLTKDYRPMRINRLGGKLNESIDIIREKDLGWSQLMATITYLESIPYKVNSNFLQFVESHTEMLQHLGLMAKVKKDIPPSPIPKGLKKEEMSLEQITKLEEWKALKEKRENEHHFSKIKLLRELRVLELANKLNDEAGDNGFYYRWYADFRGRLYPVNSFLSFQASPLAKALLEFAEETPIKPGCIEDLAWCEFVEYGFRLLGEYKDAPYRDFEHLYENEQELKQLCRMLTEPFSLEALIKKGELNKKNALPFISWLLELKRLLDYWDMESITTGHPIRKDATCSSMQHMAALSGDANVLKATNCASKMDAPVDLYTTIVPNMEELGLDREWIKKFVMTWAYNSTDYTRKNEITKAFEEKYGLEPEYKDIEELNCKLKQAASQGLGRIIKLGQLLKSVYRVCVLKPRGKALSITPTGLVVDSTKVDWPSYRFRIHTFDAVIRIQMKDLDCKSPKTNYRKTRQSWVANVIHSLDAALLQIAINVLVVAENVDVHLFPIHDCVVTRPGDMSPTLQALSHSFKYMYEPDTSTGVPNALLKMMIFWSLDKHHPELYNDFIKSCQGVPGSMFNNMRYFFK